MKKIFSKRIAGKEVIILIGRGVNCKCADCPVLYGGECPYDEALKEKRHYCGTRPEYCATCRAGYKKAQKTPHKSAKQK